MPSLLMPVMMSAHLFHHEGRKPERRLVHEEKSRFGHQCPADGEHLLFAAAQCPRPLAAPLPQPGETLPHLLEVFPDGGPVFPQVCANHDVVENAHAGEKPPAFRNLNDAELDDLMAFHAVYSFVPEPHFTRAYPEQTGYGFQDGALAGPVVADKPGDSAFRDIYGDAFDGFRLVVVDTDIFQPKQHVWRLRGMPGSHPGFASPLRAIPARSRCRS